MCYDSYMIHINTFFVQDTGFFNVIAGDVNSD